MRARTLIVLVIVAAVAATIALFLDTSSQPGTSVADGSLLYPGLKSALNDVDRIELTPPEAADPIVLDRTESGWVVAPKAGYAADPGRMRQLLLRLAEAHIVEVKTSNPDLYPRLSVADPGSPEGAGTLLVVGTSPRVSLIVGAGGAAGGAGTYIRRQGEEQSYLIDTDLDVTGTASDWLDRDLFDVDGSALAKITITHSDGDAVELIRIGDRLVVAGVPEGRELSNSGVAQPIARALAGLRFDDVVPAGDFDGGDPEATADFHVDDGRRITVQAWRRDDSRWVAFDVALDPAWSPADEPADATGSTDTDMAGGPDAAAAGPSEDIAPPRADQESVAREDADLAGWVFRIPVYKYDQMVRRMDDLLKPKTD